MALTEHEKAILRLKAEGVPDYTIARKLKMETPKRANDPPPHGFFC
jgi:hypothetical protein